MRGVRAVFFDAVGTVIHPEPSAGAVYAEVGRRFGSQLDANEVRRRFGRAFAEQEAVDAGNGHRTSEAREVDRWRQIVAQVLDDVTDRERCFAALYDHFAKPSAWRVEDGAGEVLTALRQRWYAVGLASNFDHRLRGVVDGLLPLEGAHLLISSEVGWKKPAPEFFARLCAVVGLEPGQVLFVGDDVANDYDGARHAGLQALLFDTSGREESRLRSLRELEGRIGEP